MITSDDNHSIMGIARRHGLGVQPLVVKPKRACQIIDCGNTRLYELLAAGELESFLDGRSRKITVASLNRYVERRLAANVAKAKMPPLRTSSDREAS
jgi:hypothetical protein